MISFQTLSKRCGNYQPTTVVWMSLSQEQDHVLPAVTTLRIEINAQIVVNLAILIGSPVNSQRIMRTVDNEQLALIVVIGWPVMAVITSIVSNFFI